MSSERLIPVCGVSGFGFAISRTAIVIPPASNGGPSNPAITRLRRLYFIGASALRKQRDEPQQQHDEQRTAGSGRDENNSERHPREFFA